MKIIPVIDLKSGLVVQAIKGDRSKYKPVQSQLCSGSSPVDIVTALLETTQSKTLYIADLDAIEQSEPGVTDNFSVIKNLSKQFSHITFWVDAGFKSLVQLNQWKKISNLRPVIGTESHNEITSLQKLLQSDSILSLDFKNSQLLGTEEILNIPKSWPEDVIIMSLNTVGSNMGPDLKLIKKIQALNSDLEFYAAGGIRGFSDIENLKQIQLRGTLVATALHSKKLTVK